MKRSMLLWILALLCAIAVAVIGILLHQLFLEITGFVVAAIAAGIFLWSATHLSLTIRPPRPGPAPEPEVRDETLHEIIFQEHQSGDNV